MITTRYNIYNAENQIIGTLVANNTKTAADKLKLKYPSAYPFLRLSVAETFNIKKED